MGKKAPREKSTIPRLGGSQTTSGPTSANFGPNLNNPKNGQKDPKTQIGQEPHFGNFQTLASGNHQRPPAQVQKGFPSTQGKTSPSPKDPGVVQIWYNIPLCTIFAQKSNGDVFTTKLCLFNPSPQIHHPF
ncbi:hypothetical protein O181_077887 [Austropuccinia psidii MF-1]|uniref:Uncharacterized protein n=1 Tax=Austropuccinia psidii MF-1 TaxID=1389203 RepID=A0A9Q3FJF7_9BASI|nr:hypothetical protein [Austropuccinia psidii MF-1]